MCKSSTHSSNNKQFDFDGNDDNDDIESESFALFIDTTRPHWFINNWLLDVKRLVIQ